MSAFPTSEVSESGVRDALARVVGETSFQRYFQDSTRLRVSDGALEIEVPSAFHRDRLDRRFRRELAGAAREALHGVEGEVSIRWLIEPRSFGGSSSGGGASPPAGGGVVSAPGEGDGARRVSRVRARSGESDASSDLSEFVVGASNRLAYEASRRFAEVSEAGFGSLCLHGACGVGKTHLVRGLCRRFRSAHSGARVRCTTGERFANEYIASIREGEPESFRRRHRRLDLLCVDDFDFIAGKKATQTEFLHTIEALCLGGGRVVVSCGAHPRSVADLDASIVSRVVSGMVVEVEPADFETRLEIVGRFLQRRGLSLESGAMEAVAASSHGSVRELEGAVTRVEAYARLMGEGSVSRLTVSRVRQILGGERGAASRRPVRLGEVLDAACAVSGVEVSEVLGPSRHRRVVLARSLAARLARDVTNHSYPEIAKALNRRNHSTIVTACQRFTAQMESGVSVGATGRGGRALRVVDLYERARGRLLGRVG